MNGKTRVYRYKDFTVVESDGGKVLKSENANYYFNKKNGNMITWGKTHEEDAELFPGPTIADIEITTSCTGVDGVVCPFCYKSNNPNGKHMTLDTFKKVFEALPKTLTQIAFGADSKAETNPDTFAIMQYARDNGIIPNITVAQITDETADKLASICGAVAISRYANKDACYDSVKKLTDRGMDQVNIHMMISEETFERALETVKDISSDPRLSKLNAIVFLSLKTKGRGERFHSLRQEKFNTLVSLCKDKGISYGFDSCSSLKFFHSLNDVEYEMYKGMIMPCESTLESSYINVDAEFFPCSFTEGTEEWETGISVIENKNFIENVWNNPRVYQFRNKLLATKSCNEFGCRECPIYKV